MEHGGLPGLRDENLLESAIQHPRSLWYYEGITNLAALAAALGYRLSRRHAFADGNKRISFLAMAVFLDVNGRELVAEEANVVKTMRSVAAGDVTEDDLARWITEHLT